MYLYYFFLTKLPGQAIYCSNDLQKILSLFEKLAVYPQQEVDKHKDAWLILKRKGDRQLFHEEVDPCCVREGQCSVRHRP